MERAKGSHGIASAGTGTVGHGRPSKRARPLRRKRLSAAEKSCRDSGHAAMLLMTHLGSGVCVAARETLADPSGSSCRQYCRKFRGLHDLWLWVKSVCGRLISGPSCGRGNAHDRRCSSWVWLPALRRYHPSGNGRLLPAARLPIGHGRHAAVIHRRGRNSVGLPPCQTPIAGCWQRRPTVAGAVTMRVPRRLKSCPRRTRDLLCSRSRPRCARSLSQTGNGSGCNQSPARTTASASLISSLPDTTDTSAARSGHQGSAFTADRRPAWPSFRTTGEDRCAARV
jgi:hypothetical protein